jgi:site-specific DNA recombinase
MIPERLERQKQKTNAVRSNKAVGYIRVSTDEQVNNESLPTQKARIEQYAHQEGLEIVKWFVEEGVSAKTVKKRDAMKEMLIYLARNKGKIGYTIFYKMWRASRDAPSYYSDIRATLSALGVSVRSATEPISDTPIGRYLEGSFILAGQLDNEVKGETAKDNMSSVAKQGWWQGSPPPGYSIKKVKINVDKHRSTLKMNEHAKTVLSLYEEYSTGQYTKADIKRMAREKGLKNVQGGWLNDTSIDRLLSQPAYAGYVCNKHTNWEMFDGKHIAEAIISPDLFDKVQRVLDQQSRRANKKDKRKIGVNPQYPFAKWLMCPNCHKNYRGSAPRSGNGAHFARYGCSSKECVGKSKSMKADLLHAHFADMLGDITPTEGVLKLYKEILDRQAIKQLGNINKRLNAQRKRLGELDKERLEALRNANNGSLSSDEKDEVIAYITADKAEIQESISELEEQQQVKQSAIEYALNFMHDVQRLWLDADPDLKIRFQKMIFPEGLTFDTSTSTFGTSTISPLYTYAPIKKDLSVKEKSLLVTPRGVEPLIFRMRT